MRGNSSRPHRCNGTDICNRYCQDRNLRHIGNTDRHLVRALVGADTLLQAGIGIVLPGTIHVGHVVERHGRLLLRHLAWLRRIQRLRKQEHQDDEPALRSHGTAVDEGHIESYATDPAVILIHIAASGAAIA
jgi:hypothetical protein